MTDAAIKDILRDAWEWALGYCLACPGATSGGYRHWRCDLKRGHEGPHRFRNYIWRGPGYPTEYMPVDHQAGHMHPARPSRYTAGIFGRDHVRQRGVLNEQSTVNTRRRIMRKDGRTDV